MRWWRTAQRYVVNIDVNVLAEDSQFKASTLNISKTGCFIITENEIPIKTVLNIRLKYFDFSVDCKGYVVRKGKGKKLIELSDSVDLSSEGNILLNLKVYYVESQESKNTDS